MKVLVLGSPSSPETSLIPVLRGLAEAGIRIDLATPKKIDEEWFDHRNLGWLYAPSWDGGFFRKLLALTRLSAFAALQGPGRFRRLYSNKSHGDMPGVYRSLPVTAGTWDLIYIPSISAAIKHLPVFDSGIPVIVTCHATEIEIDSRSTSNETLREDILRVFWKAAAVHFNSEALRRDAMDYGLDYAKSWVIRGGIDTNFFTPAPEQFAVSSDTLRIINVSSLRWSNGQEYALLALQRLLSRGVSATLTLVGDGPEYQRVLYTIHDMNLQTRVRLAGSQPPEVVRDYLRQSDVYIHTALHEGVSNSVLEAMSCGIAIVGHESSSMTELITNGVEGFLVAQRDTDALTTALYSIRSRPWLQEIMARAAREKVIQKHHLKRRIFRFIEMFDKTRRREPVSVDLRPDPRYRGKEIIV